MAIDWHSSWQYIRLWKQGWTIDINQVDGGIWWQRLNECKRHQSASDYCNCHQIPPRPLTGHADPLAPHPPHTLTHISTTSTARPCTPQVLFLEHPADIHTNTHTLTVHLYSFYTCWKFFFLSCSLWLPHLKATSDKGECYVCLWTIRTVKIQVKWSFII